MADPGVHDAPIWLFTMVRSTCSRCSEIRTRATDVEIRRHETAAEIVFRDGSIGSTLLELGSGAADMTDAEILQAFNDVVRAMERSRAEYNHVAIEVPDGRAQIYYASRSEQWVPRGDVLRCYIDDGGPDGEAVVEIDGQALSMHEFGRLLATHGGWGMRIVFVPDDRLTDVPVIEMHDPEDGPTSG